MLFLPWKYDATYIVILNGNEEYPMILHSVQNERTLNTASSAVVN